MIFLSLKRRGVCVCVCTCTHLPHAAKQRMALSYAPLLHWASRSATGENWVLSEPFLSLCLAPGELMECSVPRTSAELLRPLQYLIFQPLLPRLFVCELFAPNVTYDPGSSNKSAGLCQWWTAASTLDQTASGKVEARLWSQASRETSYRSK